MDLALVPLYAKVCIYAYFATLAILSIFGAHKLLIVYLYYKNKKKPIQNPAPLIELPVVTVQLPVYNELYVVERLIDTCCNLDYPRDRLEIQFLDDSDDETSELAIAKINQMREKGINIVYLHRPNRIGNKAGNLDYGLKCAKGKFTAIFDADFLPPRDFLLNTIHYFSDPSVGVVQTRWDHLNRDFSLLTNVQAIFHDGHFIIEQTARNRSGRFAIFNGTAGIWRKKAIEQSGGWQYDTLTEDLDLSIRAQLKGWKIVYLPHIATPAELPVEVSGFMNQQHRWAKGTVQTMKKLFINVVKSNATFYSKIEVFFLFFNYFVSLFGLALILLMLPMTIIRAKYNIYTSFLFDIVTFIGTTLSVGLFYACSQKEVTKKWLKGIIYLPALFSIGIGLCVNNTKAIFEGIFNINSNYERTPKYNSNCIHNNFINNKYYGKLKLLPTLVQLIMFIYIVIIVSLFISYRMYISTPFMIMSAAGFFYLAVLSLLQSRLASR